MPNESKTILAFLREQFDETPKSMEILGTWTISGEILRSDSYDATTRSFKYYKYRTTTIITQDKENTDYCMAYNTVDLSSGLSLRTNAGFQPGLLSMLAGKLILTLPDYDDNGIFTFTEKTRVDGKVVEFDCVYSESGYGASNLLQRPSVAKLTMVKESSDDKIIVAPEKTIDDDNIYPIPKLTVDQAYFNVGYLHDLIDETTSSDYTITFTAPLSNNDAEIIGIIKSVNSYNASRGVNLCTTVSTFTIFDKGVAPPVKFDPSVKYSAPSSTTIRGKCIVKYSYEGKMQNGRYLIGTLEQTIFEASGDFSHMKGKESIIVEGRSDGGRIFTFPDKVLHC